MPKSAARSAGSILTWSTIVSLTAALTLGGCTAGEPKAGPGSSLGQPAATAAVGAEPRPILTQSKLTILSGDVWARFGDKDFEDAVDGDELVEGDTIRTGEDSYAVLTFANGAVVELEPESELTIEALHFDPNGDFTLLLRQEEANRGTSSKAR